MAKDKNPIPEEYRELLGSISDDPAYIAAWEYAKSKNPESNKACMVYADNHWQDYQEQNTARQLRDQAADLEEKARRIEQAEADNAA